MKTFRGGLLPVELMVDHHEIDAQHDEIFGCIERLKASSLDVDALTQPELQALVERFAYHFATEQRLAAEAMIDFSKHAKEHGRSMRLLEKACNEMRAGKLDLRTFMRFLEYWFEQHINEYDKPLGLRLAHAAPSPKRLARPAHGIGLSMTQ